MQIRSSWYPKTKELEKLMIEAGATADGLQLHGYELEDEERHDELMMKKMMQGS